MEQTAFIIYRCIVKIHNAATSERIPNICGLSKAVVFEPAENPTAQLLHIRT